MFYKFTTTSGQDVFINPANVQTFMVEQRSSMNQYCAIFDNRTYYVTTKTAENLTNIFNNMLPFGVDF